MAQTSRRFATRWAFAGAVLALITLALAPAALADHGGPTVFVDIKNPPAEDEDCNDHFRTLSAALNNDQCPLKEFDTIVVNPGIYSEGKLAVDVKGLTIRSSGSAEQTKIQGCFTIKAKKAHLEGFDINAAECDTGVSVQARDVRLSGLIVHEAGSDGVQISSASDGTQVTGSRLFNNGRYGLHALGGSHDLQITNNRVESNTDTGILLEGNSDRFTIKGNTSNLNQGAGLHVLGSDNGQITENTFNTNDMEGLKLDGSNGHTVVNNTANSNGLFGISIVSSDNNEVRSNTFSNNKAGGLALRGNGGQAQRNTVENNQITDNNQSGASGVLLQGNVTGSIVLSNTIDSNSIGVRFIASEESDAEPGNNTIDSNEITGSDNEGVLVESSAGLNLIRANTIEGNNAAGIHVMGGQGNDEYAENTIQGNGAEGIRVEKSPRNSIHDNQISGNGGGNGQGDMNDGGGITLINTQGTTLRANTIGAGEPNGILLGGTKNTRLVGNTVENRQQNGVLGMGVAQLLAEGNTVRANGGRGFALKATDDVDCTSIDMRMNTVQGNTLGGVYVNGCAGVHLQMNEIADNLRFGLWVESSKQIEARRNWWGDPSGPAGVFAGRGNAVVFVNNDITGGNSTELANDQILQAVVPWLTDRVGEQTESTVSGFTLRDFGQDKVEVDATDLAGVRLSLHDVPPEAKGIAIIARYANPLPSENSIYNPANLPNAMRTVSIVTNGFGSQGRAVVDMKYADSALPEGVDEANLRLFIWNNGQWTALSGKSLPAVNVVEGTVELSLLRQGAIIALAPQGQ
ncbi:MAG: right-handed parallel beta-helix repeat-containing protein [Candidatus Bipolaricaulia bacterium]